MENYWWLSDCFCLQCRRPWFDSWVRKIHCKRDRLPTPVFLSFPCGSAGKESACDVGDLGLIPGKIPWRRDRLPTPVFLSFSCGSAGKESACKEGDLGSVPGLGRPLGEGKDYPLQYSGLENSMDYSPWDSPGQNTGVGSLSLLHGIFPTQGSNPGLPHCRQILYHLSHKGNPRILEWVAYPFSRGSS